MVKCSNCGALNEDNAENCKECGEKLPKGEEDKRVIPRIVWVGLAAVVVIALIGAMVLFNSNTGVTSFDQELIKAVNSGRHGDALVPLIQKYSEDSIINARQTYKSTTNSSNNNTKVVDEANATFHRELSYIQQAEVIRISFANQEIDENKFINELKRVYRETHS